MSLNFIKRLCRHLFIWPGFSIWVSTARRYFPTASMQRIETAIAQSESIHCGEICFVVESNLHVLDIIRKKSAKKRAIEVFSQMQVWDTEQNNGVLIYLLLADHDFEVLADRGIHQLVGAAGWERICQQMEALFRRGQFEAGVLYGITQISEQLTRHFPANSNKINELPNTPTVL